MSSHRRPRASPLRVPVAAMKAKSVQYRELSAEPVWVIEDEADPGSVTRYVSDAEGSLTLETSTTGGRLLQMVDLHGDVIARVPCTDGEAEAQWQLLRFSKFDEFGNYVSLTPLDNETRVAERYGWLGGASAPQTPSGPWC